MTHLKELLQTVVNTFLHNPNQFASGGLLLMAIGAVGASLRAVPKKIWDWVEHQTTVTLSITDDQKAFYWLKIWLENQRIMKRTRHLDVFNRGAENVVLVPAPGHHWMLYKGRILSVTITRSDTKQMNQPGNYAPMQRAETMTFKTIGRRQTVFRNLMADVEKCFKKNKEKKPELYAWGGWGEWEELHAFAPRPLDTVILPEADKTRVVKELEKFRNDREWYTKMGIPYRKGLLFYGPPGTGKTSLVSGLASHFNCNIYIMKLLDMNDAGLVQAAKNVEPNSLLILEDIDSVSSTHDRSKKKEGEGDEKSKGVTLSGLLNVMDGLLSPAGAIFIMTTNHKEKLDPALIRPGRVDLELHVTYARPEQKQQLYNRFFPGECPAEYLEREMSMADLQQALMARKLGLS